MFVGEAPGASEDEQGLPFVGRAGKLLDTLLGEVSLERGDVFIANVLKCRPPGNRDPQPAEIDACRGYLERQVELIAAAADLHARQILDEAAARRPDRASRSCTGRDEVITLGERDVRLYPLFHPAAALYTPSMLATRCARNFARIPGSGEDPPRAPSAARRELAPSPRRGSSRRRPMSSGSSEGTTCNISSQAARRRCARALPMKLVSCVSIPPAAPTGPRPFSRGPRRLRSSRDAARATADRRAPRRRAIDSRVDDAARDQRRRGTEALGGFAARLSRGRGSRSRRARRRQDNVRARRRAGARRARAGDEPDVHARKSVLGEQRVRQPSRPLPARGAGAQEPGPAGRLHRRNSDRVRRVARRGRVNAHRAARDGHNRACGRRSARGSPSRSTREHPRFRYRHNRDGGALVAGDAAVNCATTRPPAPPRPRDATAADGRRTALAAGIGWDELDLIAVGTGPGRVHGAARRRRNRARGGRLARAGARRALESRGARARGSSRDGRAPGAGA